MAFEKECDSSMSDGEALNFSHHGLINENEDDQVDICILPECDADLLGKLRFYLATSYLFSCKQ